MHLDSFVPKVLVRINVVANLILDSSVAYFSIPAQLCAGVDPGV